GDQQQLSQQGSQRPTDGNTPSNPNEVFSDDWWGHAKPVFEIHGYFRTRAELFQNFSLGRHPGDNQNLWAPPVDSTYYTTSTQRAVNLCTNPATNSLGTQTCYDKTQSSANLRLRFNPELHISDNLRILSQIDALDNLVLGSTPESYTIKPGAGGTTGYVS